MTTPEFILLSDGDIVGIRHIIAILFVEVEGEKRCELILSNGVKKKISEREGENIRSTMIGECMLLPI